MPIVRPARTAPPANVAREIPGRWHSTATADSGTRVAPKPAATSWITVDRLAARVTEWRGSLAMSTVRHSSRIWSRRQCPSSSSNSSMFFSSSTARSFRPARGCPSGRTRTNSSVYRSTVFNPPPSPGMPSTATSILPWRSASTSSGDFSSTMRGSSFGATSLTVCSTSGRMYGATVGIMPMASEPTRPPWAPRAWVTKVSKLSSVACANGSSPRPTGVTMTLRVDRSISCTPSPASSAASA